MSWFSFWVKMWLWSLLVMIVIGLALKLVIHFGEYFKLGLNFVLWMISYLTESFINDGQVVMEQVYAKSISENAFYVSHIVLSMIIELHERND